MAINRAFVLLAVISCRDSSDSKPEPERKERVDAALARVAGIQPKLAAIRELSFKQAVPATYQSADEFKGFIRKELAKELPGDKSKRLSAAYLHIGLLAKPIDLAAATESAFSSQAGAYYDPAQKKFFIVMVPKSDLMLDTMSAHELTHGLQDQHFDLRGYLSPKPALEDDAQMARQFITEGDATLAMMVYMASAATDAPAATVMSLLGDQIEHFATTDVLADVGTRTEASAFKDIDPDLKKSMDAIGDLPPIIIRPLLESYMKGARVALVAYQHGGWKAVDALFKTPPDSTEQVLHPASKLFPTRDRPIAVTLPPNDGDVLTSNTLGELQWSVYFSIWAPTLATAASEGWGGDHYAVVKRADGSLVGLIATTWDSPADTKEFADAYAASFEKRFPKHDRKHAIKTDGTKVFVLDGTDDAKLLDRLVAGTTFR